MVLAPSGVLLANTGDVALVDDGCAPPAPNPAPPLHVRAPALDWRILTVQPPTRQRITGAPGVDGPALSHRLPMKAREMICDLPELVAASRGTPSFESVALTAFCAPTRFFVTRTYALGAESRRPFSRALARKRWHTSELQELLTDVAHILWT
jgi:hypothetical protein